MRSASANPHAESQFKNVQNSIKALMNAGARVTPGTDSPHIPNELSLQAELFTPLSRINPGSVYN